MLETDPPSWMCQRRPLGAAAQMELLISKQNAIMTFYSYPPGSDPT